jgi:hypothetical protein
LDFPWLSTQEHATVVLVQRASKPSHDVLKVLKLIAREITRPSYMRVGDSYYPILLVSVAILAQVFVFALLGNRRKFLVSNGIGNANGKTRIRKGSSVFGRRLQRRCVFKQRFG